MKRREFLAATAGLSLIPAIGWASTEYTPGLVDKELAAGKTVFLDFKASWCSTCAAQERVINALKSKDARYEEAVTFIDVDWDQYSNDKLTAKLNIPRRSTLVVLKGDAELGRIVAGTSKRDIKALMDIALSAATS
ncbi:thioredoxin-related protein [Rhodobacterales bacterium HTCC2150]|jgi:thioredoxin 1|nr:thioredoxin-related protein [Rhodobacterales bacterium HTCC2150] [Rhodobacteraceae bacterium HTCC2150]